MKLMKVQMESMQSYMEHLNKTVKLLEENSLNPQKK